MRVRKQVARAHEEEEAGVEREQRPEVLLRDLERRAGDRPNSGATATIVSHGARGGGLRLPQHELTALSPSAKSCEITARQTNSPVEVSRLNASPIPSPSMKV